MKEGSWLFKQGDSGDGLYILVKGVVELRRENPEDGSYTVARTAHAGEILAAASVLHFYELRATAHAISE